MSARARLERFIEKHPLAVMTRTILGVALDEPVDQLFDEVSRPALRQHRYR